jgi:hypothetical protein
VLDVAGLAAATVVDPITGSAATMLAQKIQLVSRPTFTYHASVPMLGIPSAPQCNPRSGKRLSIAVKI